MERKREKEREGHEAEEGCGVTVIMNIVGVTSKPDKKHS